MPVVAFGLATPVKPLEKQSSHLKYKAVEVLKVSSHTVVLMSRTIFYSVLQRVFFSANHYVSETMLCCRYGCPEFIPRSAAFYDRLATSIHATANFFGRRTSSRFVHFTPSP